MAEIDIERRPRRNGLSWALGIVLVLLVAGATWYFVAGPGMEGTGLGGDEEPVETLPPG